MMIRALYTRTHHHTRHARRRTQRVPPQRYLQPSRALCRCANPRPNPNPNPAYRCANATQRAAMLAVVDHPRYARTEGLYYLGWCYCTRI
eukprot:scaffold13849_cov51-Phaeocystis_antarctica.AAC.4